MHEIKELTLKRDRKNKDSFVFLDENNKIFFLDKFSPKLTFDSLAGYLLIPAKYEENFNLHSLPEIREYNIGDKVTCFIKQEKEKFGYVKLFVDNYYIKDYIERIPKMIRQELMSTHTDIDYIFTKMYNTFNKTNSDYLNNLFSTTKIKSIPNLDEIIREMEVFGINTEKQEYIFDKMHFLKKLYIKHTTF